MRILLPLLLMVPAATPAQGAADAARSFFTARARHDWAAVAEFADSAGRMAIRAHANRAIDAIADFERLNVRRTLEAAGADAPLKMMDAGQSMLGGGSILRLTFAGVSDTAVLRSMPDQELVARWFEAKDPAYVANLLMNGLFKGLLAAAGAGDQLRTELDSAMSAPTAWQVVGVLDERATAGIAHVVYRMTPGGPTGVLSFRERAGRWYLATLDPSQQVDQLLKLDTTARQAERPR